MWLEENFAVESCAMAEGTEGAELVVFMDD